MPSLHSQESNFTQPINSWMSVRYVPNALNSWKIQKRESWTRRQVRTETEAAGLSKLSAAGSVTRGCRSWKWHGQQPRCSNTHDRLILASPPPHISGDLNIWHNRLAYAEWSCGCARLWKLQSFCSSKKKKKMTKNSDWHWVVIVALWVGLQYLSHERWNGNSLLMKNSLQ